MRLPHRWTKYTDGGKINGTRFVACKVPLKETYNRSLPERKSFTPSKLLEKFPDVKLVIDLTFTNKYYDGDYEFNRKGIYYVKIWTKGAVIPDQSVCKKFRKLVDDFLLKMPEESLIAVHCTHGINRTGYLIVRYMIERLGFTPERALTVFSESRGHEIERKEYKNDILSLK